MMPKLYVNWGICLFFSAYCSVLLQAQPAQDEFPHQKASLPSLSNASIPEPAKNFPYKLNKIDKKYTLPESVEEISALSYVAEGLLAFVQDEAGKIYYFDQREAEISHVFSFKKQGDFEGVEVVETTTYALRSDGKIYEIPNCDDPESEVRSYETFLSADNNTEGLGYDPKNHALLIACKNSPSSIYGTYKGFRAVYAFDLKQKTLGRAPYLLIDLAIIQKMAGVADQDFRPSGIAVHPISGDVYLISSVGQLLIVVTPAGDIRWVKRLEKGIYQHPEGICFSPDGHLYISNEGDGGKGNILKIDYQR